MELDQPKPSSLVRKLPVAAYCWELRPPGRLLDISDGVGAVTGYPAVDFLSGDGQQIRHLILPEDREDCEASLADAAVRGTPFALQYRIRRADGRIRWIQDQGTPFGDDGNGPSRIEGILVDITERRRAEAEVLDLERQVQHGQKLESLGLLASGIAHDFNNLLMGIMGNTELARDKIGPDSEVESELGKIHRSSECAAELMSQLLTYSGKEPSRIEPVNLSRMVREMAGLLEISLTRDTTIEYRLAEDLPAVRAKSTQLRQVIMNLFTNAAESFDGRPGAIVLTTGRQRCDRRTLDDLLLGDGAEPGAYVWLEVADEGCGMTTETVERLFEPFYTTKLSGRGLGMSAVRSIVSGHGGALSVDTAPGRGTRFRLYLPASNQAAETTTDATAKKWRGTGTVLVADDDEMVRHVTGCLIERIGLRPCFAADGLEALQVLERRSAEVDLVLLDLDLPRLNGLETLREIRRLWPDVKVLLTSGHGRHRSARRANGPAVLLDRPADGPRHTSDGAVEQVPDNVEFIQKPYQMEDLRRVLQRIFRED